MDDRLKDEVQTLVDRLAAQVGQSVAIDDPDGNIIAISRHYGDEDGYRVKLVLERKILPDYRSFFDPYVQSLVQGMHDSPLVVPANVKLDVVGRIGYPIRSRGRVIAILWFIDRGGVLPEESISAYCLVLGEMLSQRNERGGYLDTSRVAESVKRVLDGETVLDETALWLFEADTQFLVVATAKRISTIAKEREDPTRDRIAVESILRGLTRLAPGCDLSLAYMDEIAGELVAVYGLPNGAPDSLGSRLASIVNDLLGEQSLPIVASVSESASVTNVRHLFVQASTSAFIGSHLERHTRSFTADSYSGLAAILHDSQVRTGSSRAVILESLITADDSFVRDTIAALLHSAGNQSEVLDRLRVHRTTLHYRLAQIQDRTGLQLNVPADMFIVTLVWLRCEFQRSDLARALASV